jgi:lysine 6-dehydrogenase
MRIMVIGGCGAMGRAMVRDLLEQPDVMQIVVADIDSKKGEEYVKGLGSGRVSFRKVDVRDRKDLVQSLKGISVVLNSTWIELYMPIFLGALEARVHYVDLGGLFHGTKKQLQCHEDFKKVGTTAVLCMGASPGMTNIAAAEGAKKFDTLEEIRVRTGAKGGKGFAYTPRTILDECMVKPMVFQDGKHIQLEPFTGFETYRLPDPVGEVEGFYSIHSETLTFPTYINKGVKQVSFKVAFSSSLVNMLKVLKELGFLSSDPISIKGAQISPREFLDTFLGMQKLPETLDEYKSFRVELIGLKNGKKTHWAYETVVESNREWGVKATAVWTGVPASIAGLMLARGEIKQAGVFPPEGILDSGKFIAELQKRNIFIKGREIPIL